MTYGSETRPLLVDVGLKFERAEMQMIRWMCGEEADMAELEIDNEDVHDRSKWRRNVNVMKRKSNPIGKRTINRYIYKCYLSMNFVNRNGMVPVWYK